MEPATGKSVLLDELRGLLEFIKPGMKVGRFVIGEAIGMGGSGVVHRARLEGSDEEYAVKFLLTPADKSGSEIEQLFSAQSATLAKIEHQSLVPLRDFGMHEGVCYLVMDLFLGPDGNPVNVKDYAAWFGGVIRPDELADVFRLLLEAFAVVHENNIIHGNMKPQNVLLQCVESAGDTWQARIAITDFGISRIMGNDFVMRSVRKSLQEVIDRSESAMPADGQALLHTYDYLSPEQRIGKGSSRRSDIFSLGLVFYELLSGTRIMGFELPSDICAGIDGGWDEFILTSTAQYRSQRFADVAEMLAALERLRYPV